LGENSVLTQDDCNPKDIMFGLQRGENHFENKKSKEQIRQWKLKRHGPKTEVLFPFLGGGRLSSGSSPVSVVYLQ
jgi:hypothetical protein